jgi:SAM-dependent methyltransferase
MMTQNWEPSAYRFRAVRSSGVAIDYDPEPMVQQQLARLKFFFEKVGSRRCAVLDWGCGSGFNCAWLKSEGQAREVVGFDLSQDAIELARQSFSGAEFLVADACDRALAIRPGHWDRIISCEVLEHVPDMDTFTANLRRHLSSDGVAFVSTPNRLVFSLGHQPSPMNHEHIKELTRDEFSDLLSAHFSRVEIYGQNFKTSALLDAWRDDVRRKIHQLETGTRWTRRLTWRQRQRNCRLIDRLCQVPLLRTAWKSADENLVRRVRIRIEMARMLYGHRDFEFVAKNLSESVWFCAIVRP